MVKRFYKTVDISESDSVFKVLCDGKSLKCKGSQDLIIPYKALALMLAQEWDSQPEDIDLKKMPVTDFVTGLNSLDEEARKKLISDSINFISTDVLFYRAEYPSALVARQNGSWDKILAWAGNLFGISFQITTSITPLNQPEKTVSAIVRQIESLDNFQLLCFYKFSSLTTSVLLGLAVIKGFLSAQDAFRLSRLDENFQNEFWGKDSEAEKAMNTALQDILTTEKIFMAGRQ